MNCLRAELRVAHDLLVARAAVPHRIRIAGESHVAGDLHVPSLQSLFEASVREKVAGGADRHMDRVSSVEIHRTIATLHIPCEAGRRTAVYHDPFRDRAFSRRHGPDKMLAYLALATWHDVADVRGFADHGIKGERHPACGILRIGYAFASLGIPDEVGTTPRH